MRVRGWTLRALTSACVIATVWMGPASASAADAQIAFFDEAGEPSVVAEVPRVMRVTGTSDPDQRLYATVGGAGREECAPSYSGDREAGFANIKKYARGLGVGQSLIYDLPGGAFDQSFDTTWKEPGAHVVCTWIVEKESEITTPIRQELTFAANEAAQPAPNSSEAAMVPEGDGHTSAAEPAPTETAASASTSDDEADDDSLNTTLVGAAVGAGIVLLLVAVVMLVRSNRRLRAGTKSNNDSDDKHQ